MSPGTNGNQSERNDFVIADWTVTPSRNLLVRRGEHVRLEPRVMDVLVHLAERPGEVVSKEDLVERVWKQRYVTDDVLTVTIYALRRALGDDARRPRYIETVSRRGYRLIAAVPAMPAAVRIPSEAPAHPEVRTRRYSWPANAASSPKARAAWATSSSRA